MIEVLAWAPDEVTARAFMVAVGIIDSEGRPLVDVQIDHVGSIVKTPAVFDPQAMTITTPAVLYDGWYVNVRYYGQSALNLTDSLPQTAPDGTALDIFERTHILDMTDARTGRALVWSALSDDPRPPGYLDTVSGVKLYDPSLTGPERARVWA